MSNNVIDKPYLAAPTCAAFHKSQAFVRGIMGPVGSSKSTASVMEMLMKSMQQEPSKGTNIRHTRWAVIRRTFPELRDTTLNTFQDWIPPSICKINMQPPMRGKMEMPLGDGTVVHAEFIFMALDSEADADKLRSLEVTGIWFNEAKEIHKVHLDMATTRVGRYPSQTKRPEHLTNKEWPSWRGIIMDTNPPHDQHWWYKMAEIDKPLDWQFFKQPPGLLMGERKDDDAPLVWVPNSGQDVYSAAENVANLDGEFNYYMRMVGGKSLEWIKVNIQGFYGTIIDGKPVYPEYQDGAHAADYELEVQRGLPLVVGIDFGRTPSAVFCQLSPNGQLRILDELCAEDMGIRTFAREFLIPHVKNTYFGMNVVYVADPQGQSDKGQIGETTLIQILCEEGIFAEPAPTNLFTPRREAVAYYLTNMRDGEPGLLLSPKCNIVRSGFKGGYRYRKMRTVGTDIFAESPEKNEYSHPHDALQYASLYFKGGYSSPSNYNNVGNGNRRSIIATSSDGWT